MSARDGGPAFPVTGTQGMTLRDYFAGEAMKGLLSAQAFVVKGEIDGTKVITAAYAFADAMIAERAEP